MMKLGMHIMGIDAVLFVLDYAPCLPMDEMIIKGIPYLNVLVKYWLRKRRNLNKMNMKNGVFTGTTSRSELFGHILFCSCKHKIWFIWQMICFSHHGYWCKPSRHIIRSMAKLDKTKEMSKMLRVGLSSVITRWSIKNPDQHPNLLEFVVGILEEAKDWTKFLIDRTTPYIAVKDHPTASVK